jgi:hypothetical protein
MAVRSKPIPTKKTTVEVQALDFISRGAAAPEDKSETGSQPVNLKIPRAILRRIDKAVEARSKDLPIPLPRTHWIMEAIAEKLRKEKF